ncbi:hypothetical protein GC098_14145 [Paenibacillus sp. LMG 31458]|uniref:Competence protein CoiA n=1 Tax=Paenibacillus phytorum TaxID=2654977 RepID=A0ABX1XVW9_9BACL|nr:competence protein CoiA family protein [Paenibacillus phytorum]NOU72554.1 hypothetical protein [Paenibacillus phytorum]
MDYAKYEGTDLTISAFINQHHDIGEKKAIDKLKRFGEKKVLFCPFCNENLILRAGYKREVHFAHIKGRTCLISSTYDLYTAQTQGQTKGHSVIRNLIYDELKSQEKIKKDVRVEYGYAAKPEEQWKLIPDIFLQVGSREIAINIITNVNDFGDRKTLNQFIKRDRFFREKGMDVVWFVEDRELADDMDNRVIHLWEAEYNLTIKTEQDEVWDALLHELDHASVERVYEIMGYKARKDLALDVRSLYYVHSLDEGIQFSVHRIILDEKFSPFRSFAVNRGYRMSMSSALTVSDTIHLSDTKQDEIDREAFKQEYYKHKQEMKEAAVIAAEQIKRQKQELAEKIIVNRRKHYVDIMKKRHDLKISLTQAELKLFEKLTLKHNYTPDNFSGILNVQVKYADLIATPAHVWQLWLFDRYIFRKIEKSDKNELPKLWLEYTVEEFKRLRNEGTFRTNSSNDHANYTFALYSYISVLNDAKILQNLGSMTTKYQRIICDRLPRFDSHKENALLQMYFEGYNHETTIEVADRFFDEIDSLQQEALEKIKGNKPKQLQVPNKMPNLVPKSVEQTAIINKTTIDFVVSQIQKFKVEGTMNTEMSLQIKQCEVIISEYNKSGLMDWNQYTTLYQFMMRM